MKPLKLFALTILLFVTGCAVEEAHWDESKLREHAIAYYADQVMDNLIRAKNGQFFLHVNINNLGAQVISELAGTVGGGTSSTDMHGRQLTGSTTATTTTNGATQSTAATTGGSTTVTTTIPVINGIAAAATGVMGTVSHMVVSPFTYSVTPRRNDQLTIGAVPELNDPDLYKAYLQFLNVNDAQKSLDSVGPNYKLLIGDDVKSVLRAQPSDKMIPGREPPDKPSNAVYYVPGTLKRWNNETYYVPAKYWNAYFQLCVQISGRIDLGKKVKPGAAAATGQDPHFLPPKAEAPAEKELKILQQKIDSLPKQ